MSSKTASKRAKPTPTGRQGGQGARRRWWLPLGAALALLVLIAAGGILITGGVQRVRALFEPFPKVSGLALLPDPSGLIVLDLATGAQQVALAAPLDGWVGHVGATRDGSRYVAQVFTPPTNGGIGTSTLVVVEPSGASTVVAQPSGEEFLAEPAFSADGASVFFTRRLTRKPNPGEAKQRIERLDLATGARTVVVDNASAPSPTPDGAALVVLRDTGDSTAVSVVPLAGGQSRDVVPARAFEGLIAPRVSPDGHTIAFGGVTSGTPPPAADGGALVALGDWLVPVAAAHNVPFDVWTVPLDGSAPPHLLGKVTQDSPFVAWSPDGRYLIARAEYNMFLIDAQNGQVWTLNDKGGYGGIDWAPAQG